MIQAGDQYWASYSAHLKDKLIKHQLRDGSWKSMGVEVTPQATAMALIALQVPLRRLSISAARPGR